ncbi:MAG: hypothetical protein ACLGHO_12060 [Gammaproteobacteria bacterium]
MSDNDLASKLARGMRRAKHPSAPETPPSGPIAASSSVARERVLEQDANPNGTSSRRAERFADQTDQAPRASLDRPWENLHPKRIWPD